MIKKLKEFRTLILVIVFLIGIGATGATVFARWLKLPKKVEETKEEVKTVEKKVTDNTATIDKLAHTVDKYIGEQRIREKAQERREKLMLDLLKK